MAACQHCGGFGTRLMRRPCERCDGEGRAVGGGDCGVCRGTGFREIHGTCPVCAGRGTISDPAGGNARARTGPEAPSGPTGDRLWDSSAFLMGWMARLPRWLVWSLSILCGLSTAIWTARQPGVLNGIIVLAGFAGLFVPVLAYGALRYTLGLSIRLTIGALQLAVVLFIGYVALVAMGVVEP